MSVIRASETILELISTALWRERVHWALVDDVWWALCGRTGRTA
jgi:hypothetical protein